MKDVREAIMTEIATEIMTIDPGEKIVKDMKTVVMIGMRERMNVGETTMMLEMTDESEGVRLRPKKLLVVGEASDQEQLNKKLLSWNWSRWKRPNEISTEKMPSWKND